MAAYAALASLMNNIEQMMNHPRLCNSFNHKQIQTLLQKSGFLLDIIERQRYGGGSNKSDDLEREITSAAHAAEDIIESYIVDQIHAGSSDDDESSSDAGSSDYVIEDVIEVAIVDQIHAESFDDGVTCCSFLLNVKSKVDEWMRRITSAAHVTEDVIEDHIVDQIHTAEDLIASQTADQVHRAEDVIEAHNVDQILASEDLIEFPRYIEEMEDLKSLIEEMEALMLKADEVLKIEREKYEQITHSTLPLKESGETGTAMVGLDDELFQLLGELTGHQSNRHTISIVGMGGTGKTTLARNIYANQLIIEHFDVRAWAIVSQQYDARGIFWQLLSSLGILPRGDEGELGEKLHKALIGRRYLIILDDMWSVEAWDKVRHYFPDDGNSSRVLLTTRLSNVASVCSSFCLTMNLLDEGKSWKLFCEKALFPNKDVPFQLENVGKEIVRSCKGLALSIVVIGGLLLKSPRTTEYWEDAAANLKSVHNSKEKQESLTVLSLSYSHLPHHLKPCFLYMGAFEEDHEIRVSTITRLWVAEGFIRPNGTRVLEEIAEGFLMDLIDRNLILVSRRRCNGKIGSCSIHDLLRDLCIEVGEQQVLFHVRGIGQTQNTDRRVVCSMRDNNISSRSARSILTGNIFPESIKCKLLRVLASGKNEVYDAPRPDAEALYENVNLRYLAYEDPYFRHYTWKLPSSVSLIWNLQTLMIARVLMRICPLVIAPSKIWKMRQLRHIKFPQIYLPCPHGEGVDVLENFQTLTTAVNLRLSEEVCKIIPNIKKLSLLYDHDLRGYNASLIKSMCNLDHLLELESLKITIKQQYRYYTLLKELTFPSSLKKLSMSHCGYLWDDMGMIGSLPRLQVLNLECINGVEWSPTNGQFCHLKFLKIDGCDLFNWNTDNSHFPVLEKLVLCYLENLREIPLDIGEIPTLGLVRVEHCKLSVAISAMRIKECQLESQENDAIQIQVRILESEMESFVEKVEAEELNLSCIQLATFGQNAF